MEKEKTIGMKIYQLRKERNVSQETLAEALDVSRQSVSRWESGSNIPEMAKIMEIAKYFDVSVSFLLDNIGEEQLQSGNNIKEILDKYNSEVNKTISRSTKKYKIMLSVAISITLIVAIFCGILCSGVKNDTRSQISAMNSQYSFLQYKMTELEAKLLQINTPQQTESVLFYGMDYKLDNYNFEDMTVDVVLDMGLRTFSSETQVVILATSGGEVIEKNMQLQNGAIVSESITVPLTDEIGVVATVINGETSQNEKLDKIYDAEKQTKIGIGNRVLGGREIKYNKNGKYDEETGLQVNFDAYEFILYYPEMENLDIGLESVRAYANINGAFATEIEVITAEEYLELHPSIASSDFYVENMYCPQRIKMAINAGDKVEFVVEVTDSLGRTYNKVMNKYSVSDPTVGDDKNGYLIMQSIYEN